MTPCKSCSAPITWATTQAGRAMPLDAAPAFNGPTFFGEPAKAPPPSLAGLFVLLPGEKTRAASEEDRRLLRPMYRSHFATCPDAPQHRRAR